MQAPDRQRPAPPSPRTSSMSIASGRDCPATEPATCTVAASAAAASTRASALAGVSEAIPLEELWLPQEQSSSKAAAAAANVPGRAVRRLSTRQPYVRE